MQKHGSGNHLFIAAFLRLDAPGIVEDAQEMGHVMRSVIAVHGMRQKCFGQRLEGFEAGGEVVISHGVSPAGGAASLERARMRW